MKKMKSQLNNKATASKTLAHFIRTQKPYYNESPERPKIRYKRNYFYAGKITNEKELFLASKFATSGNWAYSGWLKWGYCVYTQ